MPGARRYDTKQEGPFWRVHPQDAGAGGQGTGAAPAQARGATEDEPGSARGVPAQSPAHPLEVAQRYAQEHLGTDYAPIPNLPSSLRKQHPIGLAYELAADRHPEYERRVFDAYQKQRPDIAGDAKDYDDLRRRAYRQLTLETMKQFNAMPVSMSYHQHGEGNYPTSKAMAEDVLKNNHLYVYQGGEPHEFLHVVDPETKLSANDMFRAVYDYFGHAAHGTSFGPHGEERAWAAHSALFSPLAQAALSSETRGQNSYVNYSPVNALLKSRVSRLSEAIANATRHGDTEEAQRRATERQKLLDNFQYAKQAAVLLPPEMLRGEYAGGMPEYLRDLVKPQHGAEADLVYYSREPNLTRTDPRFYGTGIKGAEMRRLEGGKSSLPRTYFYVGEPRQREGGLGPHKYKTTVQGLYDMAQDPENLHQLATESNRTPFSASYNQGVVDQDAAANDLEHLAFERGYTGILNPSRRVAALFHPQEVQSEKPMGYAKGGSAHLTPEFKKWFGKSKVVDAEGKPLVLYHGTNADITEFRTGRELGRKEKSPAIYFSENPEYAGNYAGQITDSNSPALYPVHIKGNIFDPANEEHMTLLLNDKNIRRGMSPYTLEGRMRAHEYATYLPRGNFGVLEQPRVQNALKRLGFEGYKTNEIGKNNYAVFSPYQIKSAIGNRGTYDPNDPDITKAEGGAVGYAKGGLVGSMDAAAQGIKRQKGTWAEFANELRKLPGVKPAEWTAREMDLPPLSGAAAGAPPPVLDRSSFLRQLGYRGDIMQRPSAAFHTKENPDPRGHDQPYSPDYEYYTLPGGENYREMLMTYQPQTFHGLGPSAYRSSHFENVPNVLAHARLKDRTGPNGEKILHAEELQSDWHQEGRKRGYVTPEVVKAYAAAQRERASALQEKEQARAEHAAAAQRGDAEAQNHWANRMAELTGPYLKADSRTVDLLSTLKRGVPDAPWKKDWHELLLKQLLLHAAENGYDALAVTPGEEQARRYDLSKHISELHHSGSDLVAYGPNGQEVIRRTGVREEDLPTFVGKELADKLLQQPKQGTLRSLTGEDVKVGGEGMKGFYDKMVPTAMSKLGKQYGAQVGQVPLKVGNKKPTLGDAMDAMARLGMTPEAIHQDPEYAQTVLAKLNAEWEKNPERTVQLHSLPITPEMREQIKQNGVPMFAKGGKVGDSDAFKKWFRKSRVADAEGNPLTVYHGTKADILKFNTEGGGGKTHGTGTFFSSSPHLANTYAMGEGANVIPAHLSLQFPMHVDAEGRPWNAIRQSSPVTLPKIKGKTESKGLKNTKPRSTRVRHLFPGEWDYPDDTASVDDLARLARNTGYDGLIVRRVIDYGGTPEGGARAPSDVYVAFHPNQIKSAIGNQGTFDPNESDVTMAEGGKVAPTMGALAALRRRS